MYVLRVFICIYLFISRIVIDKSAAETFCVVKLKYTESRRGSHVRDWKPV